jgi:type II secretory pathway pseudopilin PulG
VVLVVIGIILSMALPLLHQNQSARLVSSSSEGLMRARIQAREASEAKLRGESPEDLRSNLATVNPGLAIHGDKNEPLKVLPVGSLKYDEPVAKGGIQRLVAESFPYGAFAPNGTVVLESAYCWTNPLAGTDDPMTQFSGRSVWLAADTSVSVQDPLGYGEIHGVGSDLRVEATGNFAVFDRSEYEGYGDLLWHNIEQTRELLKAHTMDKTSLFVGKLSMSQIVNLVTKGDHKGMQFLSLQQALEWPFFTFPTIKTRGPVLDIRLHVPMAADGVNFKNSAVSGGKETSSADIRRLRELGDQIQALEWSLKHSLKDIPPSGAATPSDHTKTLWSRLFPDDPLPFSDGKGDIKDIPVEFDPENDLRTGVSSESDDGENSIDDIGDLTIESDGTEVDVAEGGWYIIADRVTVLYRKAKDSEAKLEAEILQANIQWSQTQKKFDAFVASLPLPPHRSEAEKLRFLKRQQEHAVAEKSHADNLNKLSGELKYWTERAGSAYSFLVFTIMPEFGAQKGLNGSVEFLEGAIEGAKSTLTALVQRLADGGSGEETGIEGPNRDQERALIGKGKLDPFSGYDGASYGRVLGRVWSAVKKIFSDALDTFPMEKIRINLLFKTITIKIPAIWRIPEWILGIGKNMINSLRRLVEDKAALVHLGSAPLAEFPSGSHIQVTTLTVPRERSHAIKRNASGTKVKVTIIGDLWVQRGATLYVEGDLSVQKPANQDKESSLLGKGLADFLKPQGRIVLEEGATLLVDGNLQANLVVASAPPHQVHSITSAILCDGDVTILHGTRSGIVMDELAKAAGSSAAGKGLEIFLQDVAPNLAKLTFPKPEVETRRLFSGPFHPRAAYFGRYPVTIRAILPTGPIYPTFEPIGQNANNLVFRAFAIFYAVHLNLTLGENFFPHSDWWLLGRGRVPVFPKTLKEKDLEKSRAPLSRLNDALGKLTSFSFVGDLKNQAQKAVKDFLSGFFSKILPNTIVSMAKSAMNPFGSLPRSLPGFDLGAFTGGDVSLRERALTAIGDELLGLFPKVVGKDEDRWARTYLPECAGVMIYARNDLRVGSKQDSDLASGFFVAGRNLDMQTHTVVGSLISLEGNITAGNLLYYAPFTHASLYRPRKLTGATANPAGAPTLWKNAIEHHAYGHRSSKGEAFRLPRLPLYRTLWEGSAR